jgi:hypothetical protein
MRVLLVDGQAGESVAAEEKLRSEGHEVQRCLSADGPSFPCAGLAGHDCPLDGADIDAAVLVRTDLADTRSPREDGARCALRQFVPLVLAGDVEHSPYADWASAVAPTMDDIPMALERATAALLQRHGDRAGEMFETVLGLHDLSTAGAGAEVSRTGRALLVTLHSPEEIPPDVAEVAGVRVTGAIRQMDSYAGTIDVTFEPR